MNLTGLNSNRYLVNNKVLISMSIDGSFTFDSEISMNVIRNSDGYSLPTVKLFPSPSGLTIDIASFLKGLMPNPFIPGNNYPNTIPNTESFTITFSENQTNTSNTFLNKTFIRGGRRVSTNDSQTLSINERLTPVERVPLWEGFPNAVFWIDSANNIRYSTVVNSDFKIMRQPKSCNPFYIRFLNSLGGYSFWMFNSYEEETKGSRIGLIENVLSSRSLGFKQEDGIKADTRVKREYFPLMRDLIVSPVVEVYNHFGNNDWTQIFIKPNSFTTNNYEDLAEITCDFDLNLNYNPSVTW